jgi:thiol-disulfide isomerase/thioredoxin
LGTVALVASLLAAAPLHSRAQNASEDPLIEELYPIGDYVLEIDNQLDPDAKLYISEKRPAVLVTTPKLAAAVVLFPGDKSVKTVPHDQVTERPDGSVDLNLNDAIDEPKLQVLAAWVSFSVDGRALMLKEAPWLLGAQEVPAMLEHNPEYVWRYNAYTPNQETLKELTSQTADVKVRIFFGSWCAHCRRYVPSMMKVDEALAESRIHIDYYGLPRSWNRHPVAGPLNITAVPTAIVTVGGKEAGRITGNQWQRPEEILKSILAP